MALLGWDFQHSLETVQCPNPTDSQHDIGALLPEAALKNHASKRNIKQIRVFIFICLPASSSRAIKAGLRAWDTCILAKGISGFLLAWNQFSHCQYQIQNNAQSRFSLNIFLVAYTPAPPSISFLPVHTLTHSSIKRNDRINEGGGG